MSDAMIDAAIAHALEALDAARGETRRGAQAANAAATLRLGIVSAAASGGSYTVSLVGSDGQPSETIQGARSWGGVHSPGDRVVVAWVGARPLPVILGGGGGSGSGTYVVFGGLGFAS